MSQFDGYSQLVCDRCKQTQFARTSEIPMMNWKFINRTNVSGASQSYTLCPECYPLARDILMKHDTEFSNFMLKIEAPTTQEKATEGTSPTDKE